MATRKTRRSSTRAVGKTGAAPRASRGAAGRRAAAGRSAKAGRPPADSTARPQARRRQRSASTAVKKDTMRMQTDRGTKVLWGANQRRPTRI